MLYPQAYDITFGTYMARPPVGNKPHVDRDHNQYRTPLAPTEPLLENWVRQHARQDTVVLTIEQRKLVEEAIGDLAQRYRWSIHAIAPMRDHVHVVVGAAREGVQLREGIKAVASKWLNKKYGKRTWWAEGGSARYFWERKYFENAVA